MTRSDDAPRPDVQVGMYSFRTPDPVRLATFWSELMGLPMADGASQQIAMLDYDHEVGPITWLFEPEGEEGSGRGARIGLDLHGTEIPYTEVAARAEALGASRGAEREEDGVRWIEMRDPDGNPFRIFAPRPSTGSPGS